MSIKIKEHVSLSEEEIRRRIKTLFISTWQCAVACSALLLQDVRKGEKSLPTAKMGKAKTIPKLIQCPKASKVPLLFGWLAGKFTSPLWHFSLLARLTRFKEYLFV